MQYNIYAFSMLNLGRILISDLVVTNLFMYSLSGVILLLFIKLATWLHPLLHQRCFCMRYHHFCKVNNNCSKQQINTSSWEGECPTQCCYCLQYKLYTLFGDNNSPTQKSVKMKFTLLGSTLNFTRICISKRLHHLGTKKL